MVKQLEIFKDKGKEEAAGLARLRWDMEPGFWRANVLKTRKEHKCDKCEGVIMPGSHAVVTIKFEGAKPKQEDFKKAEYWHPGGKCSELPSEEEPIF